MLEKDDENCILLETSGVKSDRVPEKPLNSGPAALPPPPTTRELHRDVWNLAWPSVMTMMLQTVNSLLDVFFVGHLPYSKEALAASGIGGQIIFLMVSVAMGVSVGTSALVARFTGAREPEQTARATGQSLTLSLVLGIVCFALFYLGQNQIVELMLDRAKDPLAAALCISFLHTALLATVPIFLLSVLMGAFRGLGDTRTPLYIQGAMIAVHIGGNLMLIYGRFGLPAMGVRGAATAFALSNLVGMAAYMLALSRQPVLRQGLHRRNLLLSLEWTWRILRIGIPASIQALIRTLAMMSFTHILAHTADGSAGVAALQIGLRSEAIAFMPGFGYSVAASALVGQSLGARDPHRAERYGWAATFQGMIVMSIMAILFFCMADPISQLFTDDQSVQHLGAAYLRINAFAEPPLALGMILTGALQGAGDTLMPTFITILTMWIIRIPVAHVLMINAGLQTRGAWFAMCISTALGGILTAILFRGGRWKKTKV